MLRQGIYLTVVAGLLASVAGCAINDPGISPQRDRFYFPTGLAKDPTGQMLYVASMNADLLYNGGTLTALDIKAIPVDLTKVAEAVAGGTLSCKPDSLDRTVWECGEKQFINPKSTVRVGDFPGELRVSSDGKRLYLPVRGDDHLLWVEVERLADGTVDLRCDRSRDSGCGDYANRDCPVWDCNDYHRVNYSASRQLGIPLEPRGIYLNETTAVYVDKNGTRRTCKDGVSTVACQCTQTVVNGATVCQAGGQTVPCCEEDVRERDCWEPSTNIDQLYLAHLYRGEISFLTINRKANEQDEVVLRDWRGPYVGSSGRYREAYDLAAWTPGDPQTRVSVSAVGDSWINEFLVSDNSRIIDSDGFNFDTLSSGEDFRGIQYDTRARRLYAVNRRPPTLSAIDMRLKDGKPRRETLWTTEVCSDPSALHLAPDPRRKGDTSNRLAYVVCFGSSQIYVVDTARGDVLDQIPTGRGPNQLVLDAAANRAYLTHFLDNTVGVIDLDPTHARFHRMVMRIGTVTDLVRN